MVKKGLKQVGLSELADEKLAREIVDAIGAIEISGELIIRPRVRLPIGKALVLLGGASGVTFAVTNSVMPALRAFFHLGQPGP